MSAADPALSEHVSAAAHHRRSASQFIVVCALAVAAALGVPASVIFEGAERSRLNTLYALAPPLSAARVATHRQVFFQFHEPVRYALELCKKTSPLKMEIVFHLEGFSS